MQEEWRDVPGWEGVYQVSSEGQVRSVDRQISVVNRFGDEEIRDIRGKTLKPGRIKSGYLMVSLSRPGGVRRYAYVHDLVTEAFLGAKPKGKEVCHRNGGRGDNRLQNLRYGTRSSNALDRHLHGTMNQARGEAHYFSKLTASDVRWIRSNAGVLTQREMGRVLGVTHSTVGNVIRGVQWAHVT